MKNGKKIKLLFDTQSISLLSDFLAGRAVREEIMQFLGVQTERELLNALDIDFYYLSFRDLSQNESMIPFYRGPDLWLDEHFRKCPLGIKWRRGAYDDKFAVDEAIEGPFQGEGITQDDICNFGWPDPQAYDYTELVQECNEFKDKIIVGGLWSGIHGDSNRMMGYENFLLNIAMNRPLVKMLVDRVTRFYLEANKCYFEAVGDKMDIFFMGNDFGAQNGLLISKEDWLDIYFENYRKLIDLAHSYGYKVMVHSCGAISELLPYFIELGVDILDPVQTTAKGMDPVFLIERYGRDIVFHGAIDTQNMLREGSSAEVYEYSLRMINILNKYGKFVIAPSNNFMPGTPVENIYAVYKAANTSKAKLAYS
jgi:uroporphyrinogen decarboxylase